MVRRIRNVPLGCIAGSVLSVALTACGGGGASNPATSTTAPRTLSGNYVFSVVGTDPADGDYAVVGSFVADGKGNIASGVADYNLGSGIDQNVALTGTYTLSGSTATVNLTDSLSVKDTFTASLVSSGNAGIQSFDGTGSGVLYPQITAGFSTPGTYSFAVTGEQQGTLSGSGTFVVGSANTFTSGNLTYQDGSTLTNYATLTGFTNPAQKTGRGQAALSGNNLSYYVLSPTQILMLGLDPRALLVIQAQKQ